MHRLYDAPYDDWYTVASCISINSVLADAYHKLHKPFEENNQEASPIWTTSKIKQLQHVFALSLIDHPLLNSFANSTHMGTRKLELAHHFLLHFESECLVVAHEVPQVLHTLSVMILLIVRFIRLAKTPNR